MLDFTLNNPAAKLSPALFPRFAHKNRNQCLPVVRAFPGVAVTAWRDFNSGGFEFLQHRNALSFFPRPSLSPYFVLEQLDWPGSGGGRRGSWTRSGGARRRSPPGAEQGWADEFVGSLVFLFDARVRVFLINGSPRVATFLKFTLAPTVFSGEKFLFQNLHAFLEFVKDTRLLQGNTCPPQASFEKHTPPQASLGLLKMLIWWLVGSGFWP